MPDRTGRFRDHDVVDSGSVRAAVAVLDRRFHPDVHLLFAALFHAVRHAGRVVDPVPAGISEPAGAPPGLVQWDTMRRRPG